MNHPFRLGLIGYPLGHSLSPQIHHAALRAMGLAGEYHLYPVPPLPEGQDMLAELARQVRQGELDGLNVTIPHKQNILPLVDEMTPLAQQAGAVNTLYRSGGRLWGDLTDVEGLLGDLLNWLPAQARVGRPALILGAGGSARATAIALGRGGWKPMIAARRVEQAAELARSLESPGREPIRCIPLEREILARQEGIDLVVNTTPLGMTPHLEGCPWPEGLALPGQAAVYDLIYNPAETVLLRQARQQGRPARNGMGMLVEQGALSLERWTGRPVPREAMWNYATVFHTPR